ncbi:hypothetical protein [Mesorhizobium sp. P5_C1]
MTAIASSKVTPMRELPKDIDADVVIEISKLLDDSPLFVPLRVHDLATRVRQRVKDRFARSFHRRTDRGDGLCTPTGHGLLICLDPRMSYASH